MSLGRNAHVSPCAGRLPISARSIDYAVSGLVLNFLPDPVIALMNQAGACRPGGVVAAYVWDYAEGMQLMRHFWDAAGRLDPAASALDEKLRFPLCHPDRLAEAFDAAGLTDVDVMVIEKIEKPSAN